MKEMLDKGYNIIFYAISYGNTMVPKSLPKFITNKLEGIFNKTSKRFPFVETLGKFRVDLATLGGKKYSDLWKSQFDQLGKVIKSLKDSSGREDQ